MTAKAALPVIPDYDSAVRVLKDPDTFPQWDGTFRTPYGLVSASMTDQIDAAWTVVPSISSLIPEVGSASSLIPDMRGGAYGFAQTALFLDPPLHARFRSLLEESWATRTYLPAVASLLAEDAKRLLAADSKHAQREFMRSVAVPLAGIALASFFGGGQDWWQRMTLDHAEMMWRKPSERGHLREIKGFEDHIWANIEQRLDGRRPDDAMSRMVRGSSDSAHGLRPAEIQTLVVQSAFANTNLVRLLGLVALALATRPDLRERIRREPARADDLVSEALRISPPLKGVFRRTARACRAGDAELDAGEGIHISFSSANRDGGRFPEPDKLDLGRKRGRSHLTFGAGIHRCPAARLSIMVASTLARAVANVQRMDLVPGGLHRSADQLSSTITELWFEV